jgi:hypothetical protein
MLACRRHQAAIFMQRRIRYVAVFWAAFSQGDPLDRVAPYHSCFVTHREFASSLGVERIQLNANVRSGAHRRQVSFVQCVGPEVAHLGDGGRPSWRRVVGVVLPPVWHQGHKGQSVPRTQDRGRGPQGSGGRTDGLRARAPVGRAGVVAASEMATDAVVGSPRRRATESLAAQ